MKNSDEKIVLLQDGAIVEELSKRGVIHNVDLNTLLVSRKIDAEVYIQLWRDIGFKVGVDTFQDLFLRMIGKEPSSILARSLVIYTSIKDTISETPWSSLDEFGLNTVIESVVFSFKHISDEHIIEIATLFMDRNIVNYML